MEQGTINTLVKSVAIVGGLVGVAFVIKKIVNKAIEKKEKARADALAAELGTATNAAVQQEGDAAGAYNPSSHVQQIDEYILGGNIVDYPDEILALFNSLTDAKLRKLADAWKKKYGRTLWYDLDDEWDSCGFWGFSDCYVPHKNRLSSVGRA